MTDAVIFGVLATMATLFAAASRRRSEWTRLSAATGASQAVKQIGVAEIMRTSKASYFRDKLDTPTEHEEQAQFVLMVEAAYPPGISALLFAIPNGGHRHIKTACDLKAEGVRPGVPDLFLAYPHKGASGLFIEMKKREGGCLSARQRYYIDLLRGQGYAVAVCKGCDEAFDAVRRYLGR